MAKTIEWAPLSIPWSRRFQTVAAAIWIFLMVLGEYVCMFAFMGFLVFGNIHVRFFCIIYLIYLYFDWDSPDLGGKGFGISWMRDSFYWKYFRDYFPLNLVKTTDLSPDRNYLFAVYPHGILSCGVFGNFVGQSKFKKLFPGIRAKCLTLKMHFNIPIYRDLIFSWGLASSSAESIKRILATSNDPNNSSNIDGNTSTAAVIVVGGAQEALNSHPNNYKIVIKNRKGFARLAIMTGTDLVPVFSFGEVDLFNQKNNPVGSSVRRFQEYIKKKTGIAPAFFYGRGMLQYTFGFIPQRKPVTTVVGAPIKVKKILDPTHEEIEAVHSEFVAALTKLFEEHKSKYIENSSSVQLIME